MTIYSYDSREDYLLALSEVMELSLETVRDEADKLDFQPTEDDIRAMLAGEPKNVLAETLSDANIE